MLLALAYFALVCFPVAAFERRLLMLKSDTGNITLADVAELAGVSAQTVSRVVNNHPYVSDGTRRRVQEAIDRLGYRPNRAARSLATQRSSMLGIISFGSSHYGPAQMVNQIEEAARAQGYGVTLKAIASMTPHDLRRAIDDLGDRAVDGLVFITPVVGVSHAALAQVCGGVPYVQIDTEASARVPSVSIDQQVGGRLAAQHLLELGHTRIASINGPLEWYGAQARCAGWKAALAAAGLTVGPIAAGDWSARSGYEAAHRLLKTGIAFSALLVANDQMALGAIRALRDSGLRVPEDVSIVGFDNIPEAAYFDPPLTTVHQDFAALGEQSVEYLVALINNPNTPPHQRVLYPHLIERQSTRSFRDVLKT